MDGEVLGILGFVFLFVVLDVAALRFGHDSRGWARELPLAGDVTITRPRLPALRIRSRAARVAQRWTGRRAVAVVLQPTVAKPFRPPVPREVLCFQRFDLAAAGKCGQHRWPNSQLRGRQRRDKRAHPRLVSVRAGTNARRVPRASGQPTNVELSPTPALGCGEPVSRLGPGGACMPHGQRPSSRHHRCYDGRVASAAGRDDSRGGARPKAPRPCPRGPLLP